MADRLVNDLQTSDELIETLAVSELAGMSDVSCLAAVARRAGRRRESMARFRRRRQHPAEQRAWRRDRMIHGGWRRDLGSDDDPDLFFTLPKQARVDRRGDGRDIPPGVAMPPQAKAPF
jgi:hypothetical protein